MGNVIQKSAGAERINKDINETLANATARGGEIQQHAETRLGPLVQPLSDNAAQLREAQRALNDLNRTLQVADEQSDLEIGAVVDEVWNTLGRPARSADFAAIAGSGVGAWTNGSATRQPHLMRVLATNLRLATHVKLQARKQEWADRVDAKAEAQQLAAQPIDAAEAVVLVLRNQRRTLANLAQVELTKYKRDLKNLGLTEVQIHEIIPSHSRGKTPTPAPEPRTPSPDPPAPAPTPPA